MNEQDAAWCTKELAQIRQGTVTYFGIMTKKLPLDLWVFQEIIADRKPEVIVEVGNLFGGTTLYLAHLLDVIGSGYVVACDIDHDRFEAKHSRFRMVTGDIGSQPIIDKVNALVDGRRCMVIHDAQHPCKPVLRDLRNLSPLVTKGQYFIVEDGVIDAAKWKPNAPGPMAAVEKFLPDHPEFKADRSRERYGITWNPMGYLERIA